MVQFRVEWYAALVLYKAYQSYQLLPVISKPFETLFNITLSKSIFSSCWKIANTLLIFKGEHRILQRITYLSLYLSCVCKVYA